VQDVRERLREGLEPVPGGGDTSRASRSAGQGGSGRRGAVNGERQILAKRRLGEIDAVAVLAALRQDPTVRYNESGRALLRLLEMNLGGTNEPHQITQSVPDHLNEKVAQLSLRCAAFWKNVALQLAILGS